MSSTSASQSKLFQPFQLGAIQLKHRVVLAPLTRLKANADNVPGDLALLYYTQRSSVPGTLLIAEGTFVSPEASGTPHVPHIRTDAQIAGWKRITDAVHAQGSFIYLQMWALGRTANADGLKAVDPSFTVTGPSAIPMAGGATPRPLTEAEIKKSVQAHVQTAENAINKAGFDGVEFHMAAGYLFDEFLQDVSNNRTDGYGGSIENRCRFPLEAVDAVVKAVGQERTAIRISPWSKFQDMRMEDPIPTFSYLVSCIKDLYPKFSYLHVFEPRVSGTDYVEPGSDSNDFLRELWKPLTFISAGGYTRESAMEVADKTGELIAFGRAFLANPDLPRRLSLNVPLTKGNRATYYVFETAEGYTDYLAAPLN